MSSSSSSSFSRYNNHRSSTQSDPSSSTKTTTKPKSRSDASSYALAKSKSTKNHHNFSAMVTKFMETRSTKTKPTHFADLVADDLRNKRGGILGLHKKLFGSTKGKGDDSDFVKKKKALALTEVKPNARSLAMVLRSERELLSQNKDQEELIIELKFTLEEKNSEVDKLKDLCLKQREEIKALKSAILFPDQQKQQQEEESVAKQMIPILQKQVTSLTGQLHCLAQDLAEVKADKYSGMGCFESSPRTPTHEQEEATDSLESSPGSPDDMFLKDLNPCLTPYANSKSKSKGYSSLPYDNKTRCHETTHARRLSKSSTDQQSVKNRSSDGNKKYTYGGDGW